MKINELGVLPDSVIYFHTPSESARKLFLTVRCVGRYHCDARYKVDRENYNSFLLLYVARGAGYVRINGTDTAITEGSIALIDCYHAHQYKTETGWDILWVHFYGPSAQGYYDLIKRSRSLIIQVTTSSSSAYALEEIFRMFHHDHQISEALINRHLVCALTDFLTHNSNLDSTNGGARDFEDVLSYIVQNLEKPILLQDLAEIAAMSPYHFCRVFKQKTGFTPHQYLLNARVNAAKFFLKTTDLPNKSIIARCGFNSESGFCTVFKRLTGRTPRQYRMNQKENLDEA